jgi:hypothetical protein
MRLKREERMRSDAAEMKHSVSLAAVDGNSQMSWIIGKFHCDC